MIAFKVFVKTQPQAIAKHSIIPGGFTVVSTFTLGCP